MSILIGRDTRLVVHGITGREGEFHSRQMLEYGTNIVAGMTPGKGGLHALDNRVPVFDTIAEAVRETGANTSCIFVPAAGAPDSILEAVGAGISTIFCITEGIPALDMLPVVEVVRAAGARLIGPELPRRHLAGPGQGRDHPGLDPPRGRGRRGLPLGHADLRGRPGDDRRRHRPVDLRRHRRRPDHRDDLPRRPPALRGRPRDRGDRAHRRDRRRAEEEAAAWAAEHLRGVPMAAFIAGRTAPEGKRMGHAGAIISGGRGTAAEKVAALEAAGIRVASSPTEIPALLREAGYRG